jgi:hypothetical protein
MAVQGQLFVSVPVARPLGEHEILVLMDTRMLVAKSEHTVGFRAKEPAAKTVEQWLTEWKSAEPDEKCQMLVSRSVSWPLLVMRAMQLLQKQEGLKKKDLARMERARLVRSAAEKAQQLARMARLRNVRRAAKMPLPVGPVMDVVPDFFDE